LVLLRARRGDEFGATPFHIACSRGNWPVVHHLLELGRRAGLDDGDGRYRLNQRDQNGETALHWAARSGRRDIVALLLAQPAIDAAAEGASGTAAQVR
jgi:ankyrin repeat protein